MQQPLIEGNELTMYYERPRFFARTAWDKPALNQVSIRIFPGKSIALIGESGSGKTTLGKIMTGLIHPSMGNVLYRGKEISKLSLTQMRPYRKQIQMIFQNGTGVFDPLDTIGDSIRETIRNYEKISDRQIGERVASVLKMTGLEEHLGYRYARELSGGQQQRANIARALVVNPEFVVCDEPVSSLDYCIRSQIIDLLKQMKAQLGLTYLFITHDLSTIRQLCDGIVVLYEGSIVEQMDTFTNLKQEILHPYTQELFASIPVADPAFRKVKNRELLWRTASTDEGCRFYHRCPRKMEQCRRSKPALNVVSKGHLIACHRL
jgi:peptide/nickel transport system ATP-binding protein